MEQNNPVRAPTELTENETDVPQTPKQGKRKGSPGENGVEGWHPRELPMKQGLQIGVGVVRAELGAIPVSLPTP